MNLRRVVLLTGLPLAASLALTGTADAKTVGSESARGDYATAIASGTAHHPRKLTVRITNRPRQRVTGNYTVVCSKGMGAGSKSGSFSGRGSFTRRLKMPMRRPDTCTVSALGSLDHGGRIRVTLKSS